MLADGTVDGLRIDHIDGLADPKGYLCALRDAGDAPYVVVEKILMPGEELPADWPAAGTTGYEVGRLLCALQIRSEEHTSELQSLMRISYAVFCLKQINRTHT